MYAAISHVRDSVGGLLDVLLHAPGPFSQVFCHNRLQLLQSEVQQQLQLQDPLCGRARMTPSVVTFTRKCIFL